MSGTLFMVATPIGNLEDITLRALRVLREADLIAAEDTRRTAKLLTHHGISTPTLSFHEHNTRGRIPQIMARLAEGKRVALVTDAGTPGLSDPGVELVQACIDKGITLDPIPGVSAPLTAAVASGFPLTPLTIYGFAPARSKDRKQWLETISAVEHTVTFFETPHRIAALLSDASSILGNRPILLGRELTKAHQEFIRGTAQAVAERLQAPRGEYTVVLGPRPIVCKAPVAVEDEALAAEFGLLTETGSPRRQAIASVARKYGISARGVYAAVERAKKSIV